MAVAGFADVHAPLAFYADAHTYRGICATNNIAYIVWKMCTRRTVFFCVIKCTEQAVCFLFVFCRSHIKPLVR